MNALRYVAATVLTLSLGGLGCREPETLDSPDEQLGFAYQEEGGNTSGGDNGASDVQFWAAEAKLGQATQRSLVSPDTLDVHATTSADLLDGTLPPALFAYAVKCGLQKSTSVSGAGESFPGMGHLATTGSWMTGALSPAASNDLFACMIAFLNPYGVTIPIALSGPNVAADGDEHAEYVLEEALWLVEGTGTARIYTAWPMADLDAVCGGDSFSALEMRLCGTSPGSCALQQGDPAVCTLVEGQGYYCKGQPALLTLLKADDMQDLHPICFPRGS